MERTCLRKKVRMPALKKFLTFDWKARIFLIIMFLFFLVEAFIHVYPFFWVINNSLKSSDEIYESTVALTKTWSVINYVDVFKLFTVKGNIGYLQMFWNSCWQTFVYLVVNLSSSTLVAYVLAKYRFPGRNLLYGIMIFTQTIPIIGTGTAAFKLKSALGMINNPWTIWLTWAMGFDYSAFVMLGTFKGVSDTYKESAELDGATDFQIFIHIMVPQIIPCMMALMAMNFVTMWNDYSNSQINLNKYPNLAYGLHLFNLKSSFLSNAKGVYYAALILTAIPGVLIYAFSQNVILKNVSVGGIKG